MSKGACRALWKRRKQEGAAAVCKRCPLGVRMPAQWGTVPLITVEEVMAGVSPTVVGESMAIILERLVEAGTPGRAAPVAPTATRHQRTVDAVKALGGRPWQSAQEVGKRTGVGGNRARRILLEMVEAGVVVRSHPLNGQARFGAVVFFALVEDKGTPFRGVPATPNTTQARMLKYVGNYPGATSREVASGINRTMGHAQEELAQCLASGWLRREGTRHEGYRWTVAGEQRNQEAKGDA